MKNKLLQTINEELGRGNKVYPGTLNIICGTYGQYKTHTLCKIAGEYLEQSKKVLYFTFETTYVDIAKRIYNNIHINKTQHLQIIEIQSTPDNNFIDNTINGMGFTPDVIIVDTLEDTLDNNYIPDYGAIKKQLEQFRQSGWTHEAEMWVSHNIMRRGKDDVGEPQWSVIGCSDSCLQIHTNDLLLSKEQIMYETIKARYSERRKLFLEDL